ncbi:MAG: hypothetical protein E7Z62_00845 [Thermoplasmata archaeon]|nr:hypothetical protein [Thermoplasmata archaeon]
MIPLQDVLDKINSGSDDYKLYLKSQGASESYAEKASLALKTLFWQAGEQKGYLENEISTGIHDGKQFSMLIGFAYTILDCIEDAAEFAHIGIKDKNGYHIECDTHFIQTVKLYGERAGSKPTNDFEAFRFLRSFICAHPLRTEYKTTSEGFIPGTYAYCKFVDYINDRPVHEWMKPKGADFWVQVLSDNNSWDDDFYICSKEIWAYVDYRYKQLIEEIHKTMVERTKKTLD